MKRITTLLFSVFITAQVLLGQNIGSSIKYLALGDSYTIGQSVPVHARWPIQLQDSLKKRGINVYQTDIIAKTGWTTSSLLGAMNSSPLDKNYNLVSILIGVNNFYQGQDASFYKTELPQIIDKALEFCNNDTSALFMVTIPDYGYTPFGQGNQATISENTDAYNAIKDSIGKTYGIPTYYITDISREGLNNPDLVASDKLHPSEIQYNLWVSHLLNQFTYAQNTSTYQINENTVSFQQQSNQVTFSSENSGILEIMDSTGRLVSTRKISPNETVQTLLTQPLSILKFSSGNKIWVKKVVLR